MAKSEKTERSWGYLELSPVCTRAGLVRVPERMQVANWLRNEPERSRKPQREVAGPGSAGQRLAAQGVQLNRF